MQVRSPFLEGERCSIPKGFKLFKGHTVSNQFNQVIHPAIIGNLVGYGRIVHDVRMKRRCFHFSHASNVRLLSEISSHLLLHNQHWYIHIVPNGIHGAAKNNVLESFMSMRAHHQQLGIALINQGSNNIGRLSIT
jgi:hypothetical protein